jgi:hypothetical protein
VAKATTLTLEVILSRKTDSSATPAIPVTTPYQAHEERDVVLRSGSTLRLRPIRPGDAPALLAFYKRPSPDSLSFRFFSAAAIDVSKAQSGGRSRDSPQSRGRRHRLDLGDDPATRVACQDLKARLETDLTDFLVREIWT